MALLPAQGKVLVFLLDNEGNQISPTNPLPVTGGGGGGGGPVTIADGADVDQGSLADAANTTGTTGTISGKLRGLIQVLLQAFNLSTPLRIDPVGSTAQPVTIASLPALPSDQSVNVAQVNGQTPALNAGISGAGTQRIVQASANVLNVTQVSVLVTSTTVIAANANRIKVRIINSSSNPVWIGPTTPATTGNGAYIPGIPGYPWTSRFEGSFYAIATGGTALVTVDEESSS